MVLTSSEQAFLLAYPTNHHNTTTLIRYLVRTDLQEVDKLHDLCLGLITARHVLQSSAFQIVECTRRAVLAQQQGALAATTNIGADCRV